MSETVTLAGYDWYAFFIALGIIAFTVVFSYYLDHIGDLDGALAVTATALGFFAILLTLAINLDAAEDHDHAQRVAAVHNLGYSDITVDGDKFTASDDGIYKSGAFVQVDGDQWIILEGK